MPLDIVTFGREIIRQGDLDPIYILLNYSDLDPATKKRWCLAYWMFYHAGVASEIASKQDIFFSAASYANLAKWPRGTERRHFRADAAQKSINSLYRRFLTPEKAVTWLMTNDKPTDNLLRLPQPFVMVYNRAMEWEGFGPWISFKVCDMLDACLDTPIDFTGSERYFFNEPVKGALWYTLVQDHPHLMEGDADSMRDLRDLTWEIPPTGKYHRIHAAVDYLLEEFKYTMRPHDPHRPFGIQEAETILCKWKSHMNGKYEPGKDVHEIMAALDWNGGGIIQNRLKDAWNRWSMEKR